MESAIDRLSGRNLLLVVTLAAVLLLPLVSSGYFVEFVMARTLMLGVTASSIVFLSAYGGLVSLAQILMFGIAGFMIGNAVGEAGSKGLKLGWNPWVAVAFALAVVVLASLILGALSSRTTGIYYLIQTLTYAVIGYYFFGQVTALSGFGGLTGIDPPPVFKGHPVRLYYACAGLSVFAYVGFRLLSRTPFGMALQGIRDDPVRMASLGFNVPLHRTLAFVVAGFVAGTAGVANIWWNGQIDPMSISIGPTLDLLIIAVIGGVSYLEGAWFGAFIFVAGNNYLRNLPLVEHIGITEARFNTVIGALVVVIMLLSPEGVSGLAGRILAGLRSGRLSGKDPAQRVEDEANKKGASA